MSIRPRSNPSNPPLRSIAAAVAERVVQVPAAPRTLFASLTVRTYVICKNHARFIEYLRQSGKKLQDCKIIMTAEQCKGVHFTSPLDELVVVSDWQHTAGGEREEEMYRLIAGYCRDKRVHDAPRWTT